MTRVTRPLQSGVRIPALDGLRGLAILSVMLHHFVLYGGPQPLGVVDRAFYRVMYSGWFGVDLFFVLSGFLITGILVDTRRHTRYFRTFYVRRALRIFPLYYGFLLLWFWLIPAVVNVDDNYREIIQEQGWYWLYVTNIHFAIDDWHNHFVIGHFWSLAIEEQFYLLWPICVFFLRDRILILAAFGMMVIALAARFVLGEAGFITAAYVSTPARLDALASGIIIALVVRQPGGLARLQRWAPAVALLTGSSLVLVFLWQGGLSTESPLVYTVGFTMLAIFFAALLTVAVVSGPGTMINRFLSDPRLRLFGAYSYGLYVFHHPIAFYLSKYVVSIQSFPTVGHSQLLGQCSFAVIAGILSFIPAWLSWHLYEAKILQLKKYFPVKV